MGVFCDSLDHIVFALFNFDVWGLVCYTLLRVAVSSYRGAMRSLAARCYACKNAFSLCFTSARVNATIEIR